MNRVMITGIGVVSPNAIGWAAFRKALRSGQSGVGPIRIFDPSRLRTKIAAQVVDFDPSRHLPAGERALSDVSRAVPMALAAAAEALANGGLDPAELPPDARRRFGVVIGSGGGGAEFTERQYSAYFAPNGHRLSIYNIPSSTAGNLSSEISIQFGLMGLSHLVSDGCTSSSDAIGYAFEHIRRGRLDRVLTGGVDATITPGILTGFDTLRILASRWNDQPEKASRPFDAARDGFVLGEGAWMFLLESEAASRARGAAPLAEIRGYGATCEAYHRVKLKDPSESARAIRMAVEDAGLGPADIGHIQMHGTSTQMNDSIETASIKLAFGSHARDIPASSVKSMIGHPQGASGAAGLSAALMPLVDGFVSPTINLDTPDPSCDLDYVPHEARPHECSAALVNTLAFGSKNAALVVSRHAL